MHEADVLRTRLAALEEQVCALNHDKNVLERQLNDVVHKYNSGESLVSSLQTEVKSLMLQVHSLSRCAGADGLCLYNCCVDAISNNAC